MKALFRKSLICFGLIIPLLTATAHNTLAFTISNSADTLSIPGAITFIWVVTPGASESFKDFHVWTDDYAIGNYNNASMPAGWNFSVTSTASGNWLNFYGGTAQTGASTFSVRYVGNLKLGYRAVWKLTSDGNDNVADGVIAGGYGAAAPSAAQVPGLTYPGLFLLLLLILLSGFLILRRKKRMVSY
ncbi:exported hypothetical protein [Candidatus Zixiibacteriota bacterium]|nr:exported hypothetical protein [candidate division Zixibacteria bacterium]